MSVPTSVKSTSLIIIASIFLLRLVSYLICEDLSSSFKIKLSAICLDTSHKRLLNLMWLLWLANIVFILSTVYPTEFISQILSLIKYITFLVKQYITLLILNLVSV